MKGESMTGIKTSIVVWPIMVLLAFTSVMCYAQNAYLTFEHPRGMPVPASVVTFEEQEVGDVKTPLKLVTSDGRQIPLIPSPENKALSALISLRENEVLRARIEPAAEWGASRLHSEWDNGQGVLANGLVQARVNEQGLSISWTDPLVSGKAKKVVEKVRFIGWLDHSSRGQLRATVADELGLIRVDLCTLPVKTAEATVENDRAVLVLRKKLQQDFIQSAVFEERYTLFEKQGVVEYRVTVYNEGEIPLFLANVQGGESVIRGVLGDVMKADRIALYRESLGVRLPPSVVLERRFSRGDFLKPSQGWGRKTALLEAPNGYALGTSLIYDQLFSHMWHRWENTVDGFGIPLSSVDSPLPVEIAPGRSDRFGCALAVFSPGADAYADINKIYDAYMKTTGFMVSSPVVARYNGKEVSLNHSIAAPEKHLDAPVLTYPSADATIRTVAAEFAWVRDPVVPEYRIQISKGKDFDDLYFDGIARVVRGMNRQVDGTLHYHPEPIPAGTYFWRVQARTARGTGGEWSESRRVDFQNLDGRKALAHPISSSNPMFLFDAFRVSDMRKFKSVIPPDLRNFIAFANTGLRTHPVEIEDYVSSSAEAGIRVWLWSDDKMSMTEELFRENPHIVGVWSGEFLGNTDRFKRLVQLCAEYGRYYMVVNGGGDFWPRMFAEPGFADFVREYGKYVLFGHKTNIAHGAPITMSSVFGAWLDGMFDHLPMHFEAFYWDHAGFRTQVDQYLGNRGGLFWTMPPVFWNQQAILAMSQGCTVMAFGGQWSTTLAEWNPDDPSTWWGGETQLGSEAEEYHTAFWDMEGRVTPYWERFMVPFLRSVIRHGMIPSRDEVSNKVRIAVVEDSAPTGFPRLHHGFGRFDSLFRGTYALGEQAPVNSLIPDSSRYYWIPILPYETAGLPGKKNVNLSKLMDAGRVSELFDATYPDPGTGTAWAITVGERFYIMSPHENRSELTDYVLSFDKSPVSHIQGDIGPHRYIIGRAEKDRFWMQSNRQDPDEQSEFTIKTRGTVSITVQPQEALERAVKSAEGYQISVTHRTGPVEISVLKE